MTVSCGPFADLIKFDDHGHAVSLPKSDYDRLIEKVWRLEAIVNNTGSNRSLTAIAEDVVVEWCDGMWSQPEARHRIFLQPETRQALERLIVAALAHATPRHDDLAGIDWFNSLTDQERGEWLKRAGSARPVDAWRAYKDAGARAKGHE